jgi:hypothetical protein
MEGWREAMRRVLADGVAGAIGCIGLAPLPSVAGGLFLRRMVPPPPWGAISNSNRILHLAEDVLRKI